MSALENLDSLDWQLGAACAKSDAPVEVWFPTVGGRHAVAAARAICAECDRREPCLEYALRHRIDEGIWGGTTPTERKPMMKARKAARAVAR
jgi:WhiB family redox-sensing transcriptional regulator